MKQSESITESVPPIDMLSTCFQSFPVALVQIIRIWKGEGECLTKTCHSIEFKYLQNKKWQKQAVKSARVKKSHSRQYQHMSKIMRLDWSKTAKQFSANSRGKFL